MKVIIIKNAINALACVALSLVLTFFIEKNELTQIAQQA